MTGTLYAGTSGFAYGAWVPRFYPAGTRANALLPAYAARLGAVELNNTFYRHPTEARIAAWLAATPATFRFAVKAQKGGSWRAFGGDPGPTLEWLLRPYAHFGERLGCVLYRVPDPQPRDDARLDALLSAWPRETPLTLEFQHPSWMDDEVHARLRAAGAVLCATDLDDADEPRLFRTGTHLYLRLRRASYHPSDLDAWAERVAPFLADGMDVYVFFRHDETGESAVRAVEFRERVMLRLGRGA